MKEFDYFQPTKIKFGKGRLDELGEIAKEFGDKCLLVTTADEVLQPLYDRVKKILSNAGMEVAHFDGVQPNPTVKDNTKGAELAKKTDPDVVIGVGGGSSMDSAKAIAVEATHKGTTWDYLHFRDTQPSAATLPIISVPTTSGTGSQVTQVAVVTNSEERNKSAIFNSQIFPDVGLIDPELMLTLPVHITASTGFDVFCHSFESTLNPGSSPYVNHLAKKAIETVVSTLPGLLKNPKDLDSREKMAFADLFAGYCIANSGVTLPHGVGMAISGMYPQVMHGESLAIIYPAFTRFTWEHAIPEFALLGRILDPQLEDASDKEAAEKSCQLMDDFLKKIDMYKSLKDFDMPEEEIPELAEASMRLPDYEQNPRVATDEEMLELIKQAYSNK